MTKTKAEILALLKRTGGQGVSELAQSLGIRPMSVRQHLTHLERDGLVTSEPGAGGNGRPRYIYRLTAKAHAAAFPRRSDKLTELLVREIGSLEGRELEGRSTEEKMSLVLQRLARRLAEEYEPLVRGWPLHERIVFSTEVMHADGGFAEWARTEGGYEIRDYNCLFRRLLSNGGGVSACDWHRTFLSRMLGTEVEVSPCPDGSQECCRYVVQVQVQVQARTPAGVAHR